MCAVTHESLKLHAERINLDAFKADMDAFKAGPTDLASSLKRVCGVWMAAKPFVAGFEHFLFVHPTIRNMLIELDGGLTTLCGFAATGQASGPNFITAVTKVCTIWTNLKPYMTALIAGLGSMSFIPANWHVDTILNGLSTVLDFVCASAPTPEPTPAPPPLVA